MTFIDERLDPEGAAIVAELQRTVQASYPHATFRTRVGPDGRIFLDVYTEAENDFDIHELLAEPTVDFMIQHNRSVHIIARSRRP
jgi:hypothetical protein